MRTLVVSAYYKIPSKASHEVYKQHLMRWFRSIQCPVLFYTSADLLKELQSLVPASSTNIQWVVLDPSRWYAWNLGREFWDRQKSRDREPYHTPELAAIWYEKKEFVLRAFSYSEADVYVWCDSGCVRNDESEQALRMFCRRGEPLHDGTLHVQQIDSSLRKPFYSFPDVRIAGAIYGGTKLAWLRYSRLYDKVLQQYDEEGVSANMDQYVMASCCDRDPSLFTLHSPSTRLDPWFFFLGVL